MTAVIVAHDGAAWLPHVIDALLGQTRPVQRVVAVDTGSRDRSGAVLAGKLGRAVVFGMDRLTGYGAAVARAVQHQAASASVPGSAALPRGERTEWLWLLHDDCEPAPDALEQLLRGAAETRAAAVLGPKAKDWSDREVILEAGLTIDTVGRRITAIEPREVDQGQHDGDRDALAVGSAGMLVRRDVWEQVGGFDPEIVLFMEDVDFCWRVHAAGHRVRVVTDAVVYHAQASARNRRPVSTGRRPRLLQRRNALVTLLGNLPAWPMLAALVGNVTISLLRTLFFLVAKRPAAALDEATAVTSILGHPLRLLRARRLRSRGRRPAYGRVRADLPPGRSVRRMAEFAAAAMSRSAQLDTAGTHHATDDPSDDDSLLTDTGLAQRILTSPSVLLLAGLTVIALVAEHALLRTGPLGGGGLVPAWGGASGLWREYLQGYHPAGVGSGSSVPPYVGVIAALATLLGGKPWLAVDVLLLGCVPLAGICAYLAARRITHRVLVRVWAAASYALLPVATGAIAAGRIGTTAAFVLIPLIGLLASRMFSEPPKRARRAAWATGLTLTIGTAFVPLLWPMALIAAVVAALTLRRNRPGVVPNLAVATVLPPLLMLPWAVQVARHPSTALLEAGLQQPGLASADLPARSLLLLSPGGPGLPPSWITAGLILAALAALAARRRRGLVAAGWGVAVAGLAVALGVSRTSLQSPAGAITAWPGPELAIAAAGLLLACCAVGESAGRLAAGRSKGLARLVSPRGASAAVLALVACSVPVLAAVFWIATGVSGPVTPVTSQTVPEFVAVSARDNLQLRTLVLGGSADHVSYSLLRGTGLSLGDPNLVPDPAAQQALSSAVATLVAPGGTEAADQSQLLARFDIGFVLLRAPVNQGLVRTLDGVPGLRQVSATSAFVLWRLISLPARVQVIEPDGTVVPVPSGPVAVSGAAAPAAGGILELAEPAGGWAASLNGHALTPVASPAGSWAQAFKLPAGGGTLDVGRGGLGHDAIVVLEAIALLMVAVLALPGVRTASDAAAAPAAPAAPAGAGAAAAAEPKPGRGPRRRRDRLHAGSGTRGPGQRRAGRIAGRAAELQRKLPAALPGRGPAQAGRRAGESVLGAASARLLRDRPGSAGSPGPADPGLRYPDGLEQLPSAPARYPDEPGRYPEEPGRYPEEPGRYPDEPGRYPEEPGRYPDEPGRYPDEPGRYPAAPGRPAPEPARYAREPESYSPRPGPYRDDPGWYPPESAGYRARDGYGPDSDPGLRGRGGYPPEPDRYQAEPDRYQAEPPPERPARSARRRRHSSHRQEPGRYEPESGPYSAEPAYPRPRPDEPPGPAGTRRSPSGAWPPPDEPADWQAGAGQSGWPSDQDRGWRESGGPEGWTHGRAPDWQGSDAAGWPSGQGGGGQRPDAAGWPSDQGDGWQTSGHQPDWPAGGHEDLEPLPPAAGPASGWDEADDDTDGPRWPAPDRRGTGREGW